MRNADVLVHVVRGFDNPALTAPPDPARDERMFNDELILDLGVLEKRAERFKKEAKKGPEVDVTKKCVERLEKSEPLRTLLAEEEMRALGPGLQLLSMSPLITLYNLSEQAWADPRTPRCARRARADARRHGDCRRDRGETAMPAADQAEFLQGARHREPARNVFVAPPTCSSTDQLPPPPAPTSAAPGDRRGTPPAGRRQGPQRHRARLHPREILPPRGPEGPRTGVARSRPRAVRVEGTDYVVPDGDVALIDVSAPTRPRPPHSGRHALGFLEAHSRRSSTKPAHHAGELLRALTRAWRG